MAAVRACVVNKDYAPDNDYTYWCPLCPFRSFDRRCRLVRHIDTYHNRRHQHVANGVKQLKVVVALFDDCQLGGMDSYRLIQRSAGILKSSVKPALSCFANLIDKELRLVYTDTGPEYWSRESVEESNKLRKLGYIHYTQGFAELLRYECIVNNARLPTCLNRLQYHAKLQGNPLGGLYAVKKSAWWKVS